MGHFNHSPIFLLGSKSLLYLFYHEVWREFVLIVLLEHSAFNCLAHDLLLCLRILKPFLSYQNSPKAWCYYLPSCLTPGLLHLYSSTYTPLVITFLQMAPSSSTWSETNFSQAGSCGFWNKGFLFRCQPFSPWKYKTHLTLDSDTGFPAASRSRHLGGSSTVPNHPNQCPFSWG